MCRYCQLLFPICVGSWPTVCKSWKTCLDAGESVNQGDGSVEARRGRDHGWAAGGLRLEKSRGAAGQQAHRAERQNQAWPLGLIKQMSSWETIQTAREAEVGDDMETPST